MDSETFISQLQSEMTQALTMLDKGMPSNKNVKIQKKKNGWICVSPLEAQPEPLNIVQLKRQVDKRWHMTSLLDILKEADLRIGFTSHFKNTDVRSNLSSDILQRRLLLCLDGADGERRFASVITLDLGAYQSLRYFSTGYE